MRKLANIIWHVPFLGFINAFFTFIIGSLLILTIVGAPIGLGLVQLSKLLLRPFSTEMVSRSNLKNEHNKAWKAYGIIVSILYFPFGLALAIVTIFQMMALFITIVGIPVAIILSKSLSTFLNPVNKVCVPRAVAKELENRKAKQQIDKYLGVS